MSVKAPFDPFRALDILRPKKRVRSKKYGGLNRRMLASSVDSVVISLIFGSSVDRFTDWLHPLPPFNIDTLQQQLNALGSNQKEANRVMIEWTLHSGYVTHMLLNGTLQFLLLCFFSGICWHFWAATPGKMLFRMKIVDSKTELPIMGMQIIDRLWGYALSAIFLGLGFFWIGIDKRHQGWHDKLARTLVIIKPKRGATPDSEVADRSDFPAPSVEE